MRDRSRTTTLLIAAALGVIGCSARESQVRTASCLVTTSRGVVRGVNLGSSCAFLGIPFAAPPVGALRWKPPQPAGAWTLATLNATVPPPICPQVRQSGGDPTVGSEDCLKLNIWTPHPPPSTSAPVIVWIAGGAFTSASANLSAADVKRMAERTGAVVVAANYRVGPLGFLGHPALTAENPDYRSSGNYGFLDQRAAFVWVRDHIAAFGGNPGDVTIAGQSAGAHSVSLHVVSPGSAGLFSRAIMLGGYGSTRWRTLPDAESLGHDFATVLGCTDAARALDCIRSKTVDQVLLALPTGQQQFAETARAPWGPIVDRVEIPDQPRRLYEEGEFAHVPVIVAATRDEGWTYVDRSFPAHLSADVYEAEVEAEFGTADASSIRAKYPLARFPSPKHALAQITGDVESVCEARRIARLIRRTKTPVYLHSFEHAADALAFVFANYFASPPNDTGTEPQAPCDFWEPFFLGSIAGSVPASQP